MPDSTTTYTWTGTGPQMTSFNMTQFMLDHMTQAMKDTMTTARKAYVAGTPSFPKDAGGKAFTQYAPCQVKTTFTTVPTLQGSAAVVMRTSGERVLVRFQNGSERDFHKSELGVL